MQGQQIQVVNGSQIVAETANAEMNDVMANVTVAALIGEMTSKLTEIVCLLVTQ